MKEIQQPVDGREGRPRLAPVVAVSTGVALVLILAGVFAWSSNDTMMDGRTTARASAVQWTQQHPRMWGWMQSHWHEMTLMHDHWGDASWMRAHLADWDWMKDHWADMSWMHQHWQGTAWMYSGMRAGGMMAGPSG